LECLGGKSFNIGHIDLCLLIIDYHKDFSCTSCIDKCFHKWVMVNIWPSSRIHSLVTFIWFRTRNRMMFITWWNCTLKVELNLWTFNISCNLIIFPCIELMNLPLFRLLYIWALRSWNRFHIFFKTMLKPNSIQ
jgi:hypothetical protein